MNGNSRAERAIAALLSAKGEPLTKDQLAQRLSISPTKVPTAITEARDWFDAPIETCVPWGIGWKIKPGWKPDTSAKAYGRPRRVPQRRLAEPTRLPPAPRNAVSMAGLSAEAAKVLAALQATPGDYVSGLELCEAAGCDMDRLSNLIAELRRKQPDLGITGKRGAGYRVAGDGMPEPPPGPATAKHVHHRSVIELLAKLAPRTAEQVRDIALESGQTADEAMERLLWYGIEVHRDLAASQNPLSLVRRAA